MARRQLLANLLKRYNKKLFNLIFTNSKKANLSSLKTENRIVTQPVAIALYGILYGHPQAHLRVILEIWPQDGKNQNNNIPIRYIYISKWHAVTGKNSWCEYNGKKIQSCFTTAIPILLDLVQHYAPTKQHIDKLRTISITGGKVQQEHAGWILNNNSKRIIIQTKEMAETIIFSPEHIVKYAENTRYLIEKK